MCVSEEWMWSEVMKRTFPELRRLEGRFLGLFLAKAYEDLQKKVEDWAIWARLELGKKKCFDTYKAPICVICENFDKNFCKANPKLGQTWESLSSEFPELGQQEDEGPPATLSHPNTGEWYWCIKECPDFKRVPSSQDEDSIICGLGDH